MHKPILAILCFSFFSLIGSEADPQLQCEFLQCMPNRNSGDVIAKGIVKRVYSNQVVFSSRSKEEIIQSNGNCYCHGTIAYKDNKLELRLVKYDKSVSEINNLNALNPTDDIFHVIQLSLIDPKTKQLKNDIVSFLQQKHTEGKNIIEMRVLVDNSKQNAMEFMNLAFRLNVDQLPQVPSISSSSNNNYFMRFLAALTIGVITAGFIKYFLQKY